VTSFDVRFWKIETRKGKGTTYRVRWVVAGRPFGESFLTTALAESFRAKLITAARNGEGFDTETGLPDSMMRKLRDVSFLGHAMEFTASAWPSVSAKSRGSIIETLSRVIPVAVRNLPAAPDAALLRAALRKELNQGDHVGALTEDEARAIAWWQVWQKVRKLSLTPEQLATPLLRRPYDLRHSGVTWRLNSGVPPTEVAAWAGHSVEMLMRVYAKCMTGLEDVWINRMDGALHLEETQRAQQDRGEGDDQR
jgi:integrase